MGRLNDVSEQLPMFPLNTVLFPGVTMPLHVFEDRYRALVHHLLTDPGPAERVFGSWRSGRATRSATHGMQSVHRIGCVVQLTEVEPHEDGRFDIEVVGRQRLRLDSMDTSGAFLVGGVDLLPEETVSTPGPDEEADGR